MEDETYELGEEVTDQVRTRKPVDVVVSTRLERDIADKLFDRSEAEGKRVSQVVREAVIAYVDGRPQRTSGHGGVRTGVSGAGSAFFNVRPGVIDRAGFWEVRLTSNRD